MTSTSFTPETKGAFVQALFDRIAGRYDLLNDVISFGLHRLWKRQAVRSLQLKPGQTALDVCTGTGHLLGYLSKAVGPSGSVSGLDFSPEMLSVARSRYHSTSNISLTQGDAEHLPYEDAQFDGAVVAFGLRNVTDIDQALHEMKRVVKPGSWVVNLDTNPKPKIPGFWLYFKYIMPIFGKLLSGDKAAYDYLQGSTEQFDSPEQLAQRFERLGFINVEARLIHFGSAALVMGQKAS